MIIERILKHICEGALHMLLLILMILKLEQWDHLEGLLKTNCWDPPSVSDLADSS